MIKAALQKNKKLKKVALQFSEEREKSINDLEGPLIISWKKIMKLDPYFNY